MHHHAPDPETGPNHDMETDMRVTFATAALLLLAACNSAPEQKAERNGSGLLQFTATQGVEETANRLAAAAEERGFRIFADIDHAAGAASIGETLRPTRLIVFGNPQGGTPLMQQAQTMAIDLPLKALVYEDAEGVVRIAFNAPDFLLARHRLPAGSPVAERMTGLLAGLAEAANAQ